MACKGFWECMLKLLNFLLMVVGLAMVGYGIYLFVKYKNIASSGGDAHPTPLSLELVQLGRPMLLAVSLANNIFDKLPKACMGVIRMNAFCVVTVVHSLDSVKPQRDLFKYQTCLCLSFHQLCWRPVKKPFQSVYLSLHWNWCGCSFCCLLWLHWNGNSKWVLPDLCGEGREGDDGAETDTILIYGSFKTSGTFKPYTDVVSPRIETSCSLDGRPFVATDSLGIGTSCGGFFDAMAAEGYLLITAAAVAVLLLDVGGIFGWFLATWTVTISSLLYLDELLVTRLSDGMEIPTDKTGNFDKIYEFLEDHWEIVKWVALGAVILEERISDFIVLSRWLKLEQFWFSFILLITVGMQTIIFLLALIVRAANRPADYDSDEEYIGAPRQQNRQPLINRQTVPTTGVSAANTLDQRPNRNDAWSTRMREKEFAIDVYCGFELMYGLDTSEFTYNPSEAGRHPQAATQPAEEGSRCMIM
ncbi:hypothetical protein SASPL_140696 [Salvia splendens]|uniref:Uncharacterized protein n=1 Tax=Salvia splendens TaxID=180675 RepID=A0A8X8WQU4_SALSN|nr:hypothetical protein SASPL_140696 [Salvia splendens]